jgi:hypothetical protein
LAPSPSGSSPRRRRFGSGWTFRLGLPAPGDIDVAPAESMPPVQAPDATLGAVLVTVMYDLAPGMEDAFLARAERLRHARQRTGGIDWRLFRDTAVAGRFLETFLVGSWEEHERQHARQTRQDAALLSELDGLLAPGTRRRGHHYVAALRHRGTPT